MGILGEHFEGRHVIGWSGHKSEQTIKQYVRKLSSKKKWEMAEELHQIIKPKALKTSQPTATVSKAPEEDVPQPAEKEDDKQNENNIQFQLEELDDAPPDDVLLQFLNQFDPITENPPANVGPSAPVEPLQPNNTMNISNVQNVQNVLANQRMIPNMYFGGHSTVTINYNFSNPK